MSTSSLPEFAHRYAAAWCSHEAARVAACYAEEGSLAINGGAAAVGRARICEAVQTFMTSYPDLEVTFDRLEPLGERVLFYWTFIGRNTGPGGNGTRMQIGGYEDWKIGADGLIADSKSFYDAREWDRQASR